MTGFNQKKFKELEVLFTTQLMCHCSKGFSAEAAAAMASALQHGVMSYWPEGDIPHGYSTETFMRAITQMLTRPDDKRYIDQKLDDAHIYLEREFAAGAAPARQERKVPNIRLVDGAYVHA